MFLPIGDEPNIRHTPVVNLALIAVNIIVFLFVSLPLMSRQVDPNDPMLIEYLRAMAPHVGTPVRFLAEQVSSYDLFVFAHGFRPADPQVSSLFFSLFLHGGWLHLAGNMLFLWIFGDNVEHRLGRVGYLVMYLLTGIAATLFFMVFALGSQVPLVGASGAISGVLGCYFMWFPRNRVRVLMVLVWFIDVVLIPARWVLGFYVLIDNVLPFIIGSTSGGVAYGAHIGGFLAGLGCASLLDRWKVGGGRRRTGWDPGVGYGPGGGRFGKYNEPPSGFGPGPVGTSNQPADLRDQDGLSWGRPSAGRSNPGPGGNAEHDGDGMDSSPAAAFRRAVSEEQWEEALRTYSLMELEGRRSLDPEDVFRLADWLTELGRFDAALAALQRFIAVNPMSPALARAHLRAGLIQLRGLGRLVAAQQHLLAVLDLSPSPPVESAARQALQELERRRAPGN